MNHHCYESCVITEVLHLKAIFKLNLLFSSKNEDFIRRFGCSEALLRLASGQRGLRFAQLRGQGPALRPDLRAALAQVLQDSHNPTLWKYVEIRITKHHKTS